MNADCSGTEIDVLRATFNHLVLPPRLPGCQDADLNAVASDVLKRFIAACHEIEEHKSGPLSDAVGRLHESLLASSCALDVNGNLDKSSMVEQFGALEPGQMLLLHITEQNAAIIIRREIREEQDIAIFEAFETSATSEDVVAAEQTLQWDFPGRSAQIPWADFGDEKFQQSLAMFLEQASMEALHSLQAKTKKARVTVAESRDTTDPALITQLLMPLFEAMGSSFQDPVLRKRVRDDVNILGAAEVPWRRLPFWLVLRVAAQRQLYHTLGDSVGRHAYKTLICVVLNQLLSDAAGVLTQEAPDLTATLCAKLSRRMAKLERERADLETDEPMMFNGLFDKISPDVKAAIVQASDQVKICWEEYRKQVTRRIHKLPRQAPGDAMVLSLPNSGEHLRNLLNNWRSPHGMTAFGTMDLPSPLDEAIRQALLFTDHMFGLVEKESLALSGQENSGDATTRFFEHVRLINDVLIHAMPTYNSNPEQMSAMVLHLFILWVRMDKCVMELEPLVGDYVPIFEPEMLDVLQLATILQMRLLQDIQSYLACRRSTGRYGTILDNISKNCLAVRYAAQSSEMRKLGDEIQHDSDASRDKKKDEWLNKCREYEKHTKDYNDGTCCCSWSGGQRDVRGCDRCWHYRARKRINITNHEEFLPRTGPARSAVLFELAIPRVLAIYRNTTWGILTKLAHPDRPKESPTPVVHLARCQSLGQYLKESNTGVTLASRKKCFRQTHYKFSHCPTPLHQVLLPFAAELELYDFESGIWIRDLDKRSTLQHICGIEVPRVLRNTLLPVLSHPPVNLEGPSSYEIQANQTECPADTPIAEFSAYQKLLGSKSLRWPNILVELGSANINFSNEDTSRFLRQLAHQAGSQLPGQVLRTIHLIFQEEVFCDRLSEQIESRLAAISTNWREYECLELLVTLSLRLLNLTIGQSRDRAKALLRLGRQNAMNWIVSLRQEFSAAADSEQAKRIAKYTLHAALLCRWTFSVHAETGEAMTAADLDDWTQASVEFQNSILADIHSMPNSSPLKRMVIRDAKMVYHLKGVLQNAIVSWPTGVSAGIAKSWSDSQGGAGDTFSRWTPLPVGARQDGRDRWLVATISRREKFNHWDDTIHFNFVEGHLLVNGKPRGKLPQAIRDDPVVRELFGSRHLLTYPAEYDGMSHRLAGLEHGHDVYFGSREGRAVVRKNRRNGFLCELIPRILFTSHNQFDLPAELVDGCTHWLQLTSGVLEIHRGSAWQSRVRDWTVDIWKRLGRRGDSTKFSKLVNPQSKLFEQIAGMFRDFERPEKLTAYQVFSDTGAGSLWVTLPHLPLQFEVRPNQKLVCRELNAEIDENQDIGVWHGLRSKIVLRNVDTGQRSVILPLGDIKFERLGMHVAIRVEPSDDYITYEIDDTLGRLTCASEAALVYTKALCHASTSFCLPDELTGKTGTEEAFLILQSGIAQPWRPLSKYAIAALAKIESLLPQREYYPPNLARLQSVKWHPELSTTIQHDGFEPLIRNVRVKSNQLNEFAMAISPESSAVEMRKINPLHRRGQLRRETYERQAIHPGRRRMACPPVVYTPRDMKITSKSLNVFEVTRMLRTGCQSLYMCDELDVMLDSWPVISGFPAVDEERNEINHGSLFSQLEDPMEENWARLVSFVLHADDRAAVMFRLALSAFGPANNMDAVRSVAAFASLDQLKAMQLPRFSSYVNFKAREKPTTKFLRSLVVAENWTTRKSERVDSAGRTKEAHEARSLQQTTAFARRLVDQWPTPAAQLAVGDVDIDLVDVQASLDSISTQWDRLLANDALETFVHQAQAIINEHKGPRDVSGLQEKSGQTIPFTSGIQRPITPSIGRELLAKVGPQLSVPDPGPIVHGGIASPVAFSGRQPCVSHNELEAIIIACGESSSAKDVRQRYRRDLLASLKALRELDQSAGTLLGAAARGPTPISIGAIQEAIQSATRTVTSQFICINQALQAGDKRSEWLVLGNLWPIMSSTTALRLLGSRFDHAFGDGMKEALVSLGLGTTALQRLHRIQRALRKRKRDDRALDAEMRNPGHENWQPIDFPDWLLIEIDGDFLIRAEQATVARAIITPASGDNSILQMNMGQGKTSCIMPMVAAVLADGDNLLRLVVPKPLITQTARMAQSRLGGLVGREISHLPFSRKTPTSKDMLKLYAESHQTICRGKGVILTSHDHMLSFKLSGWQRLADGNITTADTMVQFQEWLDTYCRDVLDECDVTLSVKTQLNYPSGPEMAVDGHPLRWQVAQQLLALAAHHVQILCAEMPEAIKVIERSGSFPIVQFLRIEAEDALNNRIVDGICAGQVELLRPNDDGGVTSNQDALRRVLSDPEFDGVVFEQALGALTKHETIGKSLLAARGLLASRILLLCLSKRWNVQYGLHPRRHPVAVPFEAKGIPSEQAEFGHPDVAILFTCLAFSYAGLTTEQFSQGLEKVLVRSDDPAAEYERWTSACSNLPMELRHWNNINVHDVDQVDKLRQHLHCDSLVVNHFMNHFVFPAHARQFEVKLQASAWDIPLFHKHHRGARTTGFSGTNDNRITLPLTIQQDDLPSLQQTNAEVLSYLLQPRNRHYQVTAGRNGQRLPEDALLRMLTDHEIRILIDAGAYILEMDNASLAKAWLKHDHKAKAAVYFDANDRAMVCFREDNKGDKPLLATLFAEDMTECLVYLDEAHTRGIDLKLPPNARGALTLALKQTKDFTVQAAMRLRLLASTQSVTFFAPPEVDRSIRDFCCHGPIDGDEELNSSHVIAWLLEQTCRTMEDLQGLHTAQGNDFCLRTEATWQHSGSFGNPTDNKTLLNALQRPERQTLDQMYGGASVAPASLGPMSDPRLVEFTQQLSRYRNAREKVLAGALDEVEQEREVQVQVEQEREVQKAPRQDSLEFAGLHEAISEFAMTGRLDMNHLSREGSTGSFEHAFACMARTRLGMHFKVSESASRLFVSMEFGRTVVTNTPTEVVDNFLRPVEWILWCSQSATALIIIPEEAEALIPQLRLAAAKSPVALVSYAAPVTRAMLLPFNDLRYYMLPAMPTNFTFPSWLVIELGIFAGRLYITKTELDSVQTYLRATVAEGDVDSEGRQDVLRTRHSYLTVNPTAFLLEWLSLRRKGQDILYTPMGHICTGRRLGQDHAFWEVKCHGRSCTEGEEEGTKQ